MLEVLQYDSAQPKLQALHLDKIPRSKWARSGQGERGKNGAVN